MNEKSTIAKQLGEQIKVIRNSKGLTQEQLGHLADLHPSHMGQIERGERSASVDTLEKLVNAFNISFEELFEFADISRQCREDSVLLEIFNELKTHDVSDQRFALNTLKALFEWKNS